jgi:arsenate reductase
MKEVGIDISSHQSKSVDNLPPEFVSRLDYVITLCAEEACPVVVCQARKLHWPLPDPASKGTTAPEEALALFRKARDTIAQKLTAFRAELRP